MRLFSVLAITAVLFGVLAGVAAAQPVAEASLMEVAAAPAKALIAPPAQETTGTVDVDVDIQAEPPAQEGTGDAAPTTTTTNNNFFLNIPWWGWLIAVLVVVLLIVAISGAGRGGGGNTTVIKD
jgi:hypothetical protein